MTIIVLLYIFKMYIQTY